MGWIWRFNVAIICKTAAQVGVKSLTDSDNIKICILQLHMKGSLYRDTIDTTSFVHSLSNSNEHHSSPSKNYHVNWCGRAFILYHAWCNHTERGHKFHFATTSHHSMMLLGARRDNINLRVYQQIDLHAPYQNPSDTIIILKEDLTMKPNMCCCGKWVWFFPPFIYNIFACDIFDDALLCAVLMWLVQYQKRVRCVDARGFMCLIYGKLSFCG